MKEAARLMATIASTDNKRKHAVQALKSHSNSSNISDGPDGKIACEAADTVPVVVSLECPRVSIRRGLQTKDIERLKDILGMIKNALLIR